MQCLSPNVNWLVHLSVPGGSMALDMLTLFHVIEGVASYGFSSSVIGPYQSY